MNKEKIRGVDIRLSDRYRLTSDAYNWILQEHKGVRKDAARDGEARWHVVGYFPNIGLALKECCLYTVRTSGCQSFGEAVRIMENTVTMLCHALQPDFEVRVKNEGE